MGRPSISRSRSAARIASYDARRHATSRYADAVIWLDYVMLVLLAALFPIWAASFGYRRLRRATPEDLPRVRLQLYRRAIGIQWTLVAIVIALWIARGRSWLDLGLVPRLTGGLIGVLVGMAVIVALVWRQRRMVLGDDGALEGVRNQLKNLELMMPASRHELTWFYRLSLTAGICEEVLYRGYLLWALGELGLPPLWALGVAAVMFGIGHSYQGWRGIILTTAVGAFLGMIYGVTSSLFAPMAFHALMDVHSGHLGYAAFARGREERAEREAEERARERLAALEDSDREPARDAPVAPEIDETVV